MSVSSRYDREEVVRTGEIEYKWKKYYLDLYQKEDTKAVEDIKNSILEENPDKTEEDLEDEIQEALYGDEAVILEFGELYSDDNSVNELTDEEVKEIKEKIIAQYVEYLKKRK